MSLSLKRHGGGVGHCYSNENEDPNNHSATTLLQHHLECEAPCSSEEKRKLNSTTRSQSSTDLLAAGQGLRSQSGTDLFGGRGLGLGRGREVFSKMIAEFCHEFKKMTTLNRGVTAASKEVEEENVKVDEEEVEANNINNSRFVKARERKPLGEVSVSKNRYDENANTLPNNNDNNNNNNSNNNHALKLRKKKNKRNDEAENIHVSLQLNKKEDNTIRTNPPTPQGFSANKSRLMVGEILREAEQHNTLREAIGEKSHTKNTPLIAAKEGRALDVLWFLKPCTL